MRIRNLLSLFYRFMTEKCLQMSEIAQFQPDWALDSLTERQSAEDSVEVVPLRPRSQRRDLGHPALEWGTGIDGWR